MIQNENNLNIYIYGSRLYGTENKDSDTDLIVIQKEYIPLEDVNHHSYTLDTFKIACEQGDIACLEVYFSRESIKEVVELPEIRIDLESFRRNNSMLTSNSWVKGKKKLIVVGDYDLAIGLKSVFHSLRILDYCIQIGQTEKIFDFTRDNFILKDLWKLSKTYQRQQLWDIIDTKYRPLFNKRKSLFKSLFPIDKQTEKSNDIKMILQRYNCYNEELHNELKSLL